MYCMVSHHYFDINQFCVIYWATFKLNCRMVTKVITRKVKNILSNRQKLYSNKSQIVDKNERTKE